LEIVKFLSFITHGKYKGKKVEPFFVVGILAEMKARAMNGSGSSGKLHGRFPSQRAK
jgi:hypothetical protein